VRSAPQKSATGAKRRLPFPCLGVDINFCLNAQCAQLAIRPDPQDGRDLKLSVASTNFPRGIVKGSGDKKNFTCGSCGEEPVVRNLW